MEWEPPQPFCTLPSAESQDLDGPPVRAVRSSLKGAQGRSRSAETLRGKTVTIRDPEESVLQAKM